MGITERIDAVTKIPPKYLGTIIPAPKAVKIELTGRCNLRCQFCSLRTRDSQPKGGDDMSLDFFKRITSEMREAGVEEIGAFYIGESFMNKNLLVKAISWCKKDLEFPYVFLTSNASLADPQSVEECMQAGLDSLKWSVNASDEKQYELMMGVNQKFFTKAKANIRAAWDVRKKGGYKCGLYASSIKFDEDQDGRMRGFLAESVVPFVDEHYWLPLYGQMTQQTQERIDELGFVPTAGNQGRIGALRDPLPCWAVLSEGHVTSNGYLSACCFDPDDKFKMANLHDTTFMEAWNGEKFQTLRAAHLSKDVSGTVCEQCVAYQ